MRLDTWVATDDLIVGDRVITANGQYTREIVGFSTRFNPAFRPTRFHDDPHAAADLNRDHEIRVAARGTFAVASCGTVVAIEPAPLLPGDALTTERRRVA